MKGRSRCSRRAGESHSVEDPGGGHSRCVRVWLAQESGTSPAWRRRRLFLPLGSSLDVLLPDPVAESHVRLPCAIQEAVSLGVGNSTRCPVRCCPSCSLGPCRGPVTAPRHPAVSQAPPGNRGGSGGGSAEVRRRLLDGADIWGNSGHQRCALGPRMWRLWERGTSQGSDAPRPDLHAVRFENSRLLGPRGPAVPGSVAAAPLGPLMAPRCTSSMHRLRAWRAPPVSSPAHPDSGHCPETQACRDALLSANLRTCRCRFWMLIAASARETRSHTPRRPMCTFGCAPPFLLQTWDTAHL